MSGHSKWSTIKHKKAAVDAKRGKVFSKLSKELTLATRLGGKDVTTNPRLRSAIAAARNANMPNDNVDRAIKKGAGELGGAVLEELSYEGYAAGGVAVMVDCLSDNRNRTAAEIRNIFTKANGALASAGAVAWMFNRKARFVVDSSDADEDKLMDLCFSDGIEVDDIKAVNGEIEIVSPPETFDQVVGVLENAGIAAKESSIVRIAVNDVRVSEASIARQVIRLLDALEENDDVQEVYDNADIDDQILDELDTE